MYVTLWSYLHSAETSDRGTIHPITRLCTVTMILKQLFQGEKFNYVALKLSFQAPVDLKWGLNEWMIISRAAEAVCS